MKIYAADCETDPFALNRIPEPFLWGIYDGKNYHSFKTIQQFMEFCNAIRSKAIIYFHNGGKFDIHYLLPFLNPAKAQIIAGRIVKIPYGNIQFRDSFACAPAALSTAGNKLEFEYWKLEKEHRNSYMGEISDYLKQDCVALYDLMKAYHKKVGKKVTLASNALAFAKKKCDISIPKTTKAFDDKFREFYYGGRVEARCGGKFENVHIYDIKSAYPYAMTFEHPIGNQYMQCAGYLKDAHFYHLKAKAFNCFPARCPETKKLIFPTDKREYFITGWEFRKAQKLGLIKEFEIIESIKFHETINFTDYVAYWFEQKQIAENEGNKRDRLISKLLLNSLYGKLAQNPLNYEEWQFKECSKEELDAGWYLSHIVNCFDGSELPVYKRDMIHKLEETYDNWQKEKIFYNVAAGASITGFVRAMLMEAIHESDHSQVIYCDTDSVASLKEINFKGSGLGSWEKEGVAREMIVCGKKLYGIKWKNGEEKISSKGVRLSYEEIEKINNGEVISWQKEAPTFSLSRGIVFIDRKIRKTA